MSSKISDLLADIPAPDLGLDTQSPVSAERIQARAFQKLGLQPRPVHSKPPLRAVCAVAACVVLATSALAAGGSSFFHNAFGTGVPGREESTVIVSDEKSEHYPASERVEVDEDSAAALVGDYVSPVGDIISLGDYTFTVEDMLIDARGIGVLTLQVENLNGHGLLPEGEPYTEAHPVPITLGIYTQDGMFLDDRWYLAEDRTDTRCEIVLYFCPFEALDLDEPLYLYLQLRTQDDPPAWPQEIIELPAQLKIPTVTCTDETVTADLSPVGLTLAYALPGSGDKILDELCIEYTDGSVYTVLGDSLYNLSVSSGSPDGTTSYLAFNRLSDTDKLAAIHLRGHYRDSEAEQQSYALCLTPDQG